MARNILLDRALRAEFGEIEENNRATAGGVANKTLWFLTLMAASAGFVFVQFYQTMQYSAGGDASAARMAVLPYMIGGCLGGFVFAMVAIFWRASTPITGSLYAACEGLALGGISALLEPEFPGISIQAFSITAGIFVAMLVLFKAGFQASSRMRHMVLLAMLGILLIYIVDIVLRATLHAPIAMIHEGGAWGIGFSLLVIAIAALNLTIDFTDVKETVEKGRPKSEEWYLAFGLVLTLVWLYLEVVRLLQKIRSGD